MQASLTFANATASQSENRSGWTVGVGVEYAFFQNWSARVEYDYLDFGSHRVSILEITAPITLTANIKQDMHLVKLGVNHKF